MTLGEEAAWGPVAHVGVDSVVALTPVQAVGVDPWTIRGLIAFNLLKRHCTQVACKGRDLAQRPFPPPTLDPSRYEEAITRWKSLQLAHT